MKNLQKSTIAYIKNDIDNLYTLFKENIFGITVIVSFTIMGFFIGSFYEERTRNIEVKYILSFEKDENIFLGNQIETTFSLMQDIFDLPVDIVNKLELKKSDFRSNISSVIKGLDSLNYSDFQIYFNEVIGNKKQLIDIGIESNFLEQIKNFRISRSEDYINNEFVISPLSKEFFDSKKTKDSFVILLRNKMKENYIKYLLDKYNQFLLLINVYKKNLNQLSDFAYAKAQKDREVILDHLDYQINLANNFNISDDIDLNLINNQINCSIKIYTDNFTNYMLQTLQMSQCFLYGAKYLEKEKQYLSSKGIDYLSSDYNQLINYMNFLDSILDENHIKKNKNLIISIINSNIDIIVPKIKIYEHQLETKNIFNKEFFTAVFFILSSFIIFFLTVIKYQRKETKV